MSHVGTIRAVKILFSLVLAVVAVVAGGSRPAAAQGSAGAVYTLTNANAANAVAVWNRAADGTLTPAGIYPTGGRGGSLGSQGALALSRNHRWLYAVNAGSNTISVFAVMPVGLHLLGSVGSGGADPVSLTTMGNLLYVLNAGQFPPAAATASPGNIAGFVVGPNGLPHPLAGSTRALSRQDAAVGPAEIAFSRDGAVLAVTEKATNKIDIYTVGRDGRATGPRVYTSNGATPFGFAFGQRRQMIVSEAAQAAASSYTVSRHGELATVSASVPTTQGAPCWVAVTADGRYAYTANAARDANSISGFSVAPDGHLALLPNGVTPSHGIHPIDMALSANSRYLYVLNSGSGTISAFRVHADGSLAPLATSASGLPASVAGLAAR